MTKPTDTDRAIDEPLARAVVYRFASELFFHPSRASRTWREWEQGLRAALETCAETGTPASVVALASACVEAGGNVDAVVGEHERVIGPTPRAGAVPYETEWLGSAGDLLQYHQISDVAAFYNAFGLDLGPECDERADHIGVELAFLHFLCVKESWAADRGEGELAAVARDAERKFLDEHVARWAPAFCARLARCAGDGFYGRAARVLEAWIADECRRLGARPGDPTLAPSESSVTLEDTCMSCGSSPECFPRSDAQA